MSVLVKLTLTDFEAAVLQRLAFDRIEKGDSSPQMAAALQRCCDKLGAQRVYDDTRYCAKCGDVISELAANIGTVCSGCA